MKKLYYGVLVALITVVVIFFAPAVNADPTQVTLPGNSNFTGVPEQKNEVHHKVTNGNYNINAGAVGPNTIPNNVNNNGTVYMTPGILDGTDNAINW